MKIFILTWCLLLISSTALQAQAYLPESGNKYFFIGVSFPIYKIKDLANSPQVYSSIQLQVRAGVEEMIQSSVSRFLVTFTFGRITAPFIHFYRPSESYAFVRDIQFSYSYYARLGDYYVYNPNYFMGGGVSLTFNNREYNLPGKNREGFNYTLAFNGGGIFRTQKNNVDIYTGEVNTALLAYSVRPNYNGMQNFSEHNIKDGNLRYGRIATIDKVFNLYCRLSYQVPITDNRQSQLNYSWELNRNTTSQPTQSVRGGFGYDVLLKL